MRPMTKIKAVPRNLSKPRFFKTLLLLGSGELMKAEEGVEINNETDFA
jgi:hypothetical protein